MCFACRWLVVVVRFLVVLSFCLLGVRLRCCLFIVCVVVCGSLTFVVWCLLIVVRCVCCGCLLFVVCCLPVVLCCLFSWGVLFVCRFVCFFLFV